MRFAPAALVLLLPYLTGTWNPGNSDTAWLLYAAGRLLDGLTYGQGVIEINPPLIVWLLMPVAGLSRLTGLSPMLVWQLVLSLFTAGSIMATLALLPHGHPVARRSGALALALAAILVVFPTSESGQREHLSVLLALPYLVLVARRAANEPLDAALAIPVGILAGFGFLIKPFFLLVPVVVEAVAWLLAPASRRWRHRPELAAIVVTTVGYLGAILLWAPAYLEVVRHLGPLYAEALARSPVELLRVGGLRPWLLAAACLIALAIWWRSRRLLELILATAGLAWAAGIFLQGKPWLYLWLPPLLLAATALQVGLLASRDWASTRGKRLWRAGAVLLAGAILGGYGLRWIAVARAARADAAADSSYARRVAAIRRLGVGGPVVALTPAHAWSFPAVLEADGRWGLRLNGTWPLTALMPEAIGPGPLIDSVPAVAWAGEWGALRLIADDILADPPALVMVPMPDTAGQNRIGDRRFNYLSMLDHDPAVRRLLSGYVCGDTIGRYAFLIPNRGRGGGTLSWAACGLPTR